MKLLYDRVFIEETGYWPGDADALGVKTTWDIEMLRNDDRSDKRRTGIVRFIGLECEGVQPGMIVSYDIRKTRDVTVEGKQLRQIREEDIWGFWETEEDMKSDLQ